MIMELLTALKAGQELSNPATWKNSQLLIAALTMFAGPVNYFLHQKGINIIIADTDISNLVSAGMTIYGVVMGYITAATSKKVGI